MLHIESLTVPPCSLDFLINFDNYIMMFISTVLNQPVQQENQNQASLSYDQ